MRFPNFERRPAHIALNGFVSCFTMRAKAKEPTVLRFISQRDSASHFKHNTVFARLSHGIITSLQIPLTTLYWLYRHRSVGIIMAVFRFSLISWFPEVLKKLSSAFIHNTKYLYSLNLRIKLY